MSPGRRGTALRLSVRRWRNFGRAGLETLASAVTSCMEPSLAVSALVSQVEQVLAGLDTAAVYTGAFTSVGTVHSTGEELEQAD